MLALWMCFSEQRERAEGWGGTLRLICFCLIRAYAVPFCFCFLFRLYHSWTFTKGRSLPPVRFYLESQLVTLKINYGKRQGGQRKNSKSQTLCSSKGTFFFFYCVEPWNGKKQWPTKDKGINTAVGEARVRTRLSIITIQASKLQGRQGPC